jgi:4-hydroxy-2-oxoheptanedioate aldolase
MRSMRPSRVLKKLRNGEVVTSIKHNLTDPRAVEISAMSGFDCIWLCMEHTSASWSALEAQIYAAKAWDTDVLIRVPRGSYSDYVKPLELDASGIMVPHIMSADDAKHVARMTRFHPIGLRPADGGNADGAYCAIPFTDYIKQANEERFVIVQIEDPEPLDQLDEICAVPGIDMIFFGPGDFSQAIGAPGQMDHPKIAEARKLVAAAARKHGKFAGTVSSPDAIGSIIEMGYQFINCASDVIALSEYASGIISGLGGKPNERAASVYG